DLGIRSNERVLQIPETPPAADVTQVGAKACTFQANRMTGGTPAFALVDGLSGAGVSHRFLEQPRRTEFLHKCDHLPDFLIGRADRRHLGSRDSMANGRIQFHVRATMTVLPGSEVGATSTFSTGPVAIGAVQLKQRGALLLLSLLGGQRYRRDDQAQEYQKAHRVA